MTPEDKLKRLMEKSGLFDDSSGDEWTPENQTKGKIEKSISIVCKAEIHKLPDFNIKTPETSNLCSNIAENTDLQKNNRNTALIRPEDENVEYTNLEQNLGEKSDESISLLDKLDQDDTSYYYSQENHKIPEYNKNDKENETIANKKVEDNQENMSETNMSIQIKQKVVTVTEVNMQKKIRITEENLDNCEISDYIDTERITEKKNKYQPKNKATEENFEIDFQNSGFDRDLDDTDETESKHSEGINKKRKKRKTLNCVTGDLETESETSDSDNLKSKTVRQNFQSGFDRGLNDTEETERHSDGIKKKQKPRKKRKTLNFVTGNLETESETSESDNSNVKKVRLNFLTGEFETDSELYDDTSIKGKKRVSKPDSWKNKQKTKEKVKNHTQRDMPLCRCRCSKKLTKNQQNFIFNRFINLKSHTEQNIYLQGCIKMKTPERYRPRKNVKAVRSRRVFEYSLKAEEKTVNVCQKAFLSVHGIKRERLQCKVQHPEKDIADGRGRQPSNVVYTDDLIKKVHRFIKNLPARSSHYCRSSSKHRKYLDSHLSVAEIHRKFLDENKDCIITYEKFRDIFVKDFNISFATPRKDICGTCEKFKVDIEAAESRKDDNKVKELKVAREVHLRKAEVFLKGYSCCEKEKNDTKMSICYDYQKNLPLPVTNVSDEYYLRQLWLHNFGIHNLTENTASMYLYTENYAQKGPNEVISALDDYIRHHKTQSQTHLEIFCDNCYSQNKNRYIFTYLDQLCARGVFSKITIYYPIPGHSMMPIDRDFALIERKRVKHEKIYSPQYYVDLIENSKNQNKFEIVFLEKNLRKTERDEDRVVKVKNFKELYDNRIRKSVVGISTCRRVKFSKLTRPEFSQAMTGENFSNFSLYKTGLSRAIKEFPEDCYDAPIKIKAAKVNDIKKLLKYIPEGEREFFNNIVNESDNNVPAANSASEDESDQTEEDNLDIFE